MHTSAVMEGASPAVHDRSLDLRGRDVRELDRDAMVVRGFLDLSDTPIRRLPRALVVEGALYLRNARDLHELPADLVVGGHLVAAGSGLRTIPGGVSVGGGLGLAGCGDLQTVGLPAAPPEWASFRDCRRLRELAPGFRTTGDLDLSGCEALERLDGIGVGGGLSLAGCRRLRRIDGRWRVGGDADFWRSGVERHPEQGRILGRVRRLSWPQIAAAGDGQEVSILISHHGPAALVSSLGPGTSVPADYVHLAGYPLDALPERLSFSGTVDLTRSELERLPAISVGGDLLLSGSARLASVSADTVVGEVLALDGCRRLASLPEGVRAPGVDVAATGLVGSGLPRSLDGCRLFWRGVEVEPRIVWHPETIAADEILREGSPQLRSVLIERFGLGRLIEAAGPEVVHEDRDAGGTRRLLRLAMPDGEGVLALSCRCPSTGRPHVLRVPEDEEIATCHAAAAWLAGVRPERYEPLVET